MNNQLKEKLREIVIDIVFKALWGETKDFVELSKTFERGVVAVAIDGWQYHLQQMVIADDPIAYLGANI
jgi:hypothetical protein